MDSQEIERRRLSLDEFAQTDQDGVEFWYARDLMRVFGYARWKNFEAVVRRAAVAAEANGVRIEDHIREVARIVAVGNGSRRPVRDYRLTRYACYLVAMNGDPRKEEIAFAQSYFAIAARRQELIERRMREVQRLQSRDALSESEKQLAGVAFERGVGPKGFARIKSRGDRALFGGYDTRAMKLRLGVPSKDPLADHLPDVTIAAKNLANSMTTHNVRMSRIRGAKSIESEHVGNNRIVRSALALGGIVPEELPAEEDVKVVRRRLRAEEKRLASSSEGFKAATAEVGGPGERDIGERSTGERDPG